MIPLKEPRNAQEAWAVARRHEAQMRMTARASALFDTDNGDPKASTTGYAACVYLDSEGNPTQRFQVGKPFKKGQGDYTKKGGGPYTVDLEAHTCNCPSFAGVPGRIADNGNIILARDGEGDCKHHLGLVDKIVSWTYELLPIKDVADRKLVKWLELVPDVVQYDSPNAQ